MTAQTAGGYLINVTELPAPSPLPNFGDVDQILSPQSEPFQPVTRSMIPQTVGRNLINVTEIAENTAP
jgi:hypothetical protein